MYNAALTAATRCRCSRRVHVSSLFTWLVMIIVSLDSTFNLIIYCSLLSRVHLTSSAAVDSVNVTVDGYDLNTLCPSEREEAAARGRSCLRKCRTDADCISNRKRCLCDGLCGWSCVRPGKFFRRINVNSCLSFSHILLICLCRPQVRRTTCHRQWIVSSVRRLLRCTSCLFL